MFTSEELKMIEGLADNFTPTQIAEKIGNGTTQAAVYIYLKKINIEPLTMGDLYKNRLYQEAHLHSREVMFGRLGASQPTFDKYVKETGVTFKSQERIEKEYQPRKSFWDRLREAPRMNEVAEFMKTGSPHIKDKYTQISSPYGIADELKPIQLKTD